MGGGPGTGTEGGWENITFREKNGSEHRRRGRKNGGQIAGFGGVRNCVPYPNIKQREHRNWAKDPKITGDMISKEPKGGRCGSGRCAKRYRLKEYK